LLNEIYQNYFLKNFKIPNSTFDKIDELFELYLMIGGMPKVLEIFLKTKNLKNVFEKQKNIIQDYKSDSIKYLSASMAQKVFSIFDNFAQQYLKLNNSYNFSNLKKNANARDYMESID
jgi:predicted AAA+ superfamily ATPase